MARDVVIICENHFQGRCERARCLAFRQKWLELVCAAEKTYRQEGADEGRQIITGDARKTL